MIYYVTLYNTKSTQREEKFPFFKQCVAIAKRMKRIHSEENRVETVIQNTDSEAVGTIEPSYGKGLGHVLSGICAHLFSSIISATMAWHLVMNESRFLFSHEFVVILLSQMEDWLKKEAISFRYRRSETTKEGWLDSSLMNYLFRPKWDGFEEMSVYQFNCDFELCLKSSLRKKKGDTDKEISQAAKAIDILGGKLREVKRLDLAEFTGERWLVIIDKVAPTPPKYPRRPGMPAKRPLG